MPTRNWFISHDAHPPIISLSSRFFTGDDEYEDENL
jgi:hypothetical protein